MERRRMERDARTKLSTERTHGGSGRWALLALLVAALGFDHAESLSERRSRIERMAPEQKEQLWRQYERFRALPAAEQERLRALNQKLSQDADAERLQQAVERFQAWLDHLSSAERAELISLDPHQRLSRIERLRKEEARQLGPDDAKAFAGWFDRMLLKQFPQERANFAALPESERRERVRALMHIYMSRPGARQRPLFAKEDFAELRKSLSPKAQQQLDEAAAPADRRALFGLWVQQVYAKPLSGPTLKMTGIGEQRLRKFFNDELDVSQRVELLRLPSDQMQRQLRRMYQQRHPLPAGKRPPGAPPRPEARNDRKKPKLNEERQDGERKRPSGERGASAP